MAEKDHKEKSQENNEKTIDPYTKEETSTAVDGGNVVEVVPVDVGEREGEDYLLEEEEALDSTALDANADAIPDQVKSHTQDEDIEEDFKERQKLASGGRDKIQKKLEKHHFESPDASAGDLDAAWDDAVQAGDEAVGGSAPTPDQDIVDELGDAIGLTYEDDEPLNSEEKFRKRDRERWELDPASAEPDQNLEEDTQEEE